MRELTYLNGEWDFMPIYDNDYSCELPKKLTYEKEKCRVPSSWRGCVKGHTVDKYDFEPMNVFEYPKEWSQAEAGVLHRSFKVPEKMKGERIFLGFDAISHHSAVYLNGKKLCEWKESYLPLYIDVTDDVILEGENELYVVCCKYKTSKIPDGTEKSTGLLGSWFGNASRGIWQDAYMFSRPKINISDKEIVTSVRENKISVFVKVQNTTGDAHTMNVKALIKDNNSVVKELSGAVSVEAGSENEAELSDLWENPVYWDTENPHLYNMDIIIEENGTELDCDSERFGFRELWAEGENFILNGTRINLRGDSWHFQGAGQQTKEYALNWCRLCKEHGANSIRFHANPHPSYYLDAADETGILVVDETAIYGSGKSMNAASEEYFENCRHHIKHFVARDKNHASVVIWSLQNEMRWVDGRDEYKKQIPEFMDIFHQCDRSSRLISLDGDNRLIDKEHTEIASLHYNIDGMINQWDRKTPLTIGEHGGLWYICPQNASMYLGLGVYDDSEYCAEGVSLKEQLFMEYARKENVSGISSFNFAHYFAESMPEEDIELTYDSLDTKGVKPRKIKQYSLTINNGKLPEEYPYYEPNVTCKYATEGMRPVTVFCDEYNHSFFDDAKITRHLYVFNDTLSQKNVTLLIKAVQDGKEIYSDKQGFVQSPGKYEVREVSFKPETVLEKTGLDFICELYHDDTLMYTMRKEYSIYPSAVKTTAVTCKKTAFYGNSEDFNIIKALAPSCEKIENIKNTKIDADILVIGSYITDKEKALHNTLSEFVLSGGRVIILEQFGYSFGSMTLNKKEFIRAHASDYSHPVLKDFSDDDFIYWYEKAYEYGPVPFITAAFEKPVEGNFNMLLECSFGDFGDGGDLWTPLAEYRNGKGMVIANQLHIMNNFNTVPQAAVLLGNMLKYAGEREIIECNTVAVVNDTDRQLLENIMLDCEFSDSADNISAKLIAVSADKLSENAKVLNSLAQRGAKVIVLPSEKRHEEALSVLFGEKVMIGERESYILMADYSSYLAKGISIVDLYGFDKPGLSQREVTNERLAFNSIDSEHSKIILASVEGTIWEDLFVNGYGSEHFKRALVKYNQLNKKPSAPFMISKAVGTGETIAVQFINNPDYDKSIRVYTRIFDNLGAAFKDDCMASVKGDAQNSLEMIMALPYMPYQDFDRAFEYYSDPEFSLNNLGEGLYGWMKKTERNRRDGYLYIANSENNTMFMTAFVHVLENPSQPDSLKDETEYCISVDATRAYKLYINGKEVQSEKITLKKGINRMFILSEKSEVPMKLKVIFKNTDGSYATNLLYRLTTDEVDPK